MFKHILVPLDGSERSERALPHAIEITPQGAKITLLYVVEVPITPFIISPSPPALPQETESYEMHRIRHVEKAKAYLQKIASSFSADQIAIETNLITGKDPAEHIVDFAEEQAIDVIVMATRGHSGVTRWIMGSVTQKVLQAAVCPVFVVPAH